MGRQDFWICTLILWAVRWSMLIVFVLIAMGPAIASGMSGDGKRMSDDVAAQLALGMLAPLGLMLIFQLALIWPEMAINMKRFHDRGQSAALATIFLVNLVPFLNYLTTIPTFFFWLINLGCLEGTPGPNRFGPSPDPRFADDQVFA